MAACAALLLTACDDAESRAEKHFQSALALLEDGDYERAVIEFRNVFKLDPLNREARSTYAALQRERGNLGEAIGQYLRLVEQYPDDQEGNLALAELYAEAGQWEEMARFVDVIVEAWPDEPKVRALKVVADYQAAIVADDDAAAEQVSVRAVELLPQLPDLIILREVMLDHHVRNGRYGDALDAVDDALVFSPDNEGLYQVRLSLLATLGDALAIEQQLLDNIERFPENGDYRTALVQYYISQEQLDEAEAALRAGTRVDPSDDGPKLTLINFLTQLRGLEPALAEVNNLLEQGADPATFRGLRAGLIFDLGDPDSAIAELRDLAASLEDTQDILRTQVVLARLLLDINQIEESDRIIAGILETDPSNVEALKMRAERRIWNDRTGEAIVDLRTALDQAPNDPAIYTLLARAHDRDGNQELVGEMLALAAEESNQAPPEALRYARYLLANQRFVPAESRLIDALRRAPTNEELLFELGNTYIGMRDFGRLQQVISTLENLATDSGMSAAIDLNARMLQVQERPGDAVSFLQSLVAQGALGLDGNVAIVRAQLAQNEPEKAKAHIEEQLAATPDDFGLRFLDASLDLTLGNVAAAEAGFRQLLSEDPAVLRVWLSLIRLLDDDGRIDAAKSATEAAIAELPDAPTLQWIKASYLESDGDIDGAIAVYEELYRANTDDLIVANNLASLLTQRSTDAETVDRAYRIARRLRGSNVPPYQDTYGWLAYLRGDYVEALNALEPAARALSQDPIVLYHLAKTQVALEDPAGALATFQAAADLLEDDDQRAFAVEVRDEISRLATVGE